MRRLRALQEESPTTGDEMGGRYESASRSFEVWFVTGSQGLYGERCCSQVADMRGCIAARSRRRRRHPGAGRRQAGGHHPRGDRAAVSPRPTPTPMPGRHRLDAHVLAGQDVDRRAAWRCASRSLHLHTQANRDLPWATIDMDFMNLNQSAHGDREFGYVLTRLRVPRTIGRRAIGRTRRSPTGSAAGLRGRRRHGEKRDSKLAGSATTCARSRSPRATRPRSRCGSACPSMAMASTIWSPRSAMPSSAEVIDRLVADCLDATSGARAALAGRPP